MYTMSDKAYIMTSPDIDDAGVLWAESQEDAEAKCRAAAEDAGFFMDGFTCTVIRAAAYDDYRGTYRTYDHPVTLELVDRSMQRLAATP